MLSEAERDVLKRLYVDEKMSAAQIGKKLGVDGKTVYNWLRQAGIPRRTRSEAAALQWGARAKILEGK